MEVRKRRRRRERKDGRIGRGIGEISFDFLGGDCFDNLEGEGGEEEEGK